MICIFVDETSDAKLKDYFGLFCTAINHTFYAHVKRDFQKILKEGGWGFDVEFKGSYLFSATKGHIEIDVNKRIELAEKILELTTAAKNTRMKLSYFRKKSKDHKKDYLEHMPFLIQDLLKKYEHTEKSGKNLVSITCDYRADISIPEIRNSILPTLTNANCELFEDVVQVNSSCHSVGVLYSDIIGYLMSRIETITHDIEIFENLTSEQIGKNGQLKKLQSSIVLVDKIRGMTIYGLKGDQYSE